jgi:putative redox protein
MEKITSYYQGDGLVEAHIGKHRLVVDKPRYEGGYDRGPTPIELFISSLGTCVAMVISTYCEEHNIDATDLEVEIRYDTDQQQTQITYIAVNIEIPYGDIQNREQAIARVAKHCSVHKTIQTLDNIEFSILGKREIISNIW